MTPDTRQSLKRKQQTNETHPQAPAPLATHVPPTALVQQALTTPNANTLSPEVVRRLQATHGNHYAQRLVEQARASAPMINPAAANVIQRNWKETPLNYSVISSEKQEKKIRTGSLTKKVFKGIEDYVNLFYSEVRRGSEKNTEKALRGLWKTLDDDSKRKLKAPKGDKDYDAENIGFWANQFFKKWKQVVEEHLAFLKSTDDAMAQFYLHYIGSADSAVPSFITAIYADYASDSGDNPDIKYTKLVAVKAACETYVDFGSQANESYGAVGVYLQDIRDELASVPRPPHVNDAVNEEKVINKPQDAKGRAVRTRVPAQANCALAACAAVIRHAANKPVTTGDLVMHLKDERESGSATPEFASIYQHPESFTRNYYVHINDLSAADQVNDQAGTGIIKLVGEYGVNEVASKKGIPLGEAKAEMNDLLKTGNFVFAVLIAGEGHWNFAHKGTNGEVEFIDYQSDHAEYEGPAISSNPILAVVNKKLENQKANTSYIAFNA